MKVSILGDSLTSLSLAKSLVNQGIKVDIFSNKKKRKYNKNQTIGISKSNIDFFNKKILNINKFLWNIKNIEIFSENLEYQKILDFKNRHNHLFSIVKNFNLYNHLFDNLKKNRLIRFSKKTNYQNLLEKKYDLIFNCDHSNSVTKKFFHNRIEKDYNSFAYVTTFKHKRLTNNCVAIQIFTKRGPIAFLPISSVETSVVFSIKGKENVNLENLIKKYNLKYEILKINKVNNFELKLSNLRSYTFKNIIAFGDILHRLHPLAGQGFNMTIRDIKEINSLIEFKKKHGLELDKSIGLDFEKNLKDKNYLFSNGIDFIYEFFNFENKLKNNYLSKLVKLLGKNNLTNRLFTKIADKGISISDY